MDGRAVQVGREVEIKEGTPIALGDVFMNLGQPNSLDGMITQYSMDLTQQIKKDEVWPLYKDRRITDRKKLEIIYEVATILMQSLGLKDLCEKIMDALFSCVERIDAGAILLIENRKGDLKEAYARSRESGEGKGVRYSKTIVERVIQEKQAIMMSDTTDEDVANRSLSMDAMKIRSVMCVPLISSSKIRGVIYVHSTNIAKGFSKDDLFLFTGLSTPAALAIENALLYTNTKRTAQALRESEEKYRNLVDNANDAVFITQNNRIKFPNPKALEMIGVPPQKILNMTLEQMIHPDDRYSFLQKYRTSLRKKEQAFTDSFRIISKKEEEGWAQLSAVPTLWEGKPAVLNIVRDITAQKNMEAQLIQSQKMEAMGTLAGGIAHDFNNILSAILGYAELTALNVPDGTKAKENIQQVIQGGHRAKELVKEILTFSRQKVQERKLIHIGPIVKEALKLIRASLPSTIEIRQNVEEDMGTVEADASQIHQVIMNLCTNAGHAMREKGGILEVSLRGLDMKSRDTVPINGDQPVSYLKLIVGDTGQGMDKKTMARIFDPYFTTKSSGEGTGLGLAVVHGIVKSLGGAITVQSKSGQGTVFTVYFPVIKENQVPPPEVVDEPLPMGCERILFVDDEPSLARMGKQMLEHLGYSVETRTSSKEALETFRSKPGGFDLVVTDLTMPELTGDRLAKELLRIRSDIPIVLCTGYSEKIPENRASDLGFAQMMMKPLLIHGLARTVREALDGGAV